jgi:hypothetical protein
LKNPTEFSRYLSTITIVLLIAGTISASNQVSRTSVLPIAHALSTLNSQKLSPISPNQNQGSRITNSTKNNETGGVDIGGANPNAVTAYVVCSPTCEPNGFHQYTLQVHGGDFVTLDGSQSSPNGGYHNWNVISNPDYRYKIETQIYGKTGDKLISFIAPVEQNTYDFAFDYHYCKFYLLDNEQQCAPRKTIDITVLPPIQLNKLVPKQPTLDSGNPVSTSTGSTTGMPPMFQLLKNNTSSDTSNDNNKNLLLQKPSLVEPTTVNQSMFNIAKGTIGASSLNSSHTVDECIIIQCPLSQR